MKKKILRRRGFNLMPLRPQQRSVVLKYEECEPHILDRVRLSKIKYGQCRWPYGDMAELNFAFCGRPVHVYPTNLGTMRSSSYCEYHHKRAYVKPGKQVGE